MSDTLTDRLAASVRTRAPFVIKYVPYGALSEVFFPTARRCQVLLIRIVGDAVPLPTCH